jgi:hypothetical protein
MKSIAFCLILLLLSFCTGPLRKKGTTPINGSTTPINQQTEFQSSSDSNTATMAEPAQMALPIVPPQWQGMAFIVLRKQEFVRPLGYELYLCKKRECDTAQIDPVWELDNHRIRCEKLAGETLLVEMVEPDGEEWMVTFLHESSNQKIFARTRQQTVPEIAPVEDLEGAKQRWLGKTVFSKRGVISSFGTNSSTSITGLRINIQDSLTVVDVRWGMTPLPVKPIWLMVASKGGKTGFIPVRFSWTNTIPGHISRHNPWDEEIFETDPDATYDWDDAAWELINNHRVIIGMTPDQVRISWGEPLSFRAINMGQGEQMVLIYLSHELIFANGKLVSIKERSQPIE